MALTVMGCKVDTKLITFSFSEPVDQTTAVSVNPAQPSSNATDCGNYVIKFPVFPPNSGLDANGHPTGWDLFMVDEQTVGMSAPLNVTLAPGQLVRITVSGIGIASAPGVSAMAKPQDVSGGVPSEAARSARSSEDLFAYPQLTEDVTYRPSVGPQAGGGGVSISAGGSGMGQVALKAVEDVLGWKASSADPKGFLGALNQSFTLTHEDGHVKANWVQRSYAVQTDLGGRISGAQASLYTRAKDALDQSLSLLDGLYPLDPDADPEYVKALREMARSQITEIVKEFGAEGLPSILRIDTYFKILLGQKHNEPIVFDPDKIKGTLGELRDIYGIYFRGNPFNNSVADEEDITNFRVISDYMTSLLQSYIANREFFIVSPKKIAFFGTQLVLISRQLSSVAETVNEVRFTLDSVFIGPDERRSLLLTFKDLDLPSIYLEDLLGEIERFVTDEGPRLLRDGGKISVTKNILPVVDTYRRMVKEARDPKDEVPDGFKTNRVRRSLDDLHKQLDDLVLLVDQVKQDVPAPFSKLALTEVRPKHHAHGNPDVLVKIFGNNFDPGATVRIRKGNQLLPVKHTDFYSAQRIDVHVDLAGAPLLKYDVEVRNPGNDNDFVSKPDAFEVT